MKVSDSTNNKTYCETRWVERHTAIQDIDTLYEPVLLTLSEISERRLSWSSDAVTMANSLQNNTSCSKFLMALKTFLFFSGFLKSLSVQLQGSSEDTEDIITAYGRVQGILAQLHSIHENATREFGIMNDANALAELSGSEINIPRRCVIQQGRNSVQANTPEEYWRRSLFIPYNDHLINELNNRFDHASSMFDLSSALLPAHVSKLTDD